MKIGVNPLPADAPFFPLPSHRGEVWAKREDEWVGWDVEARPGLTPRVTLKFAAIQQSQQTEQ